MSLSGQSSTARIEPVDPLPGKTHYLKGSGSDTWHADLPTYARVRYRGVLSGIDIVYYGNQRQLEYDVVVAPGAHPEIVRFRFDGIHGMTIDSNGDLLLKTDAAKFIRRSLRFIRRPMVSVSLSMVVMWFSTSAVLDFASETMIAESPW